MYTVLYIFFDLIMYLCYLLISMKRELCHSFTHPHSILTYGCALNLSWTYPLRASAQTTTLKFLLSRLPLTTMFQNSRSIVSVILLANQQPLIQVIMSPSRNTLLPDLWYYTVLIFVLPHWFSSFTSSSSPWLPYLGSLLCGHNPGVLIQSLGFKYCFY